NKYDVDIYVSDEEIGTLEHGTSDSFACKLETGKQKIVFKSAEEAGVKGASTINVKKNGENKYAFKIQCTDDEIIVERVNLEKGKAERSIKNLKGKTVKDAIAVADEYGYEFTYTHSVTDQDFTTSIKDVPAEYESWLVMSIEDIDTDAKTAIIYVNSKENQERIEKEDAQKSNLEERLDEASTCAAIALYGKSEYPYGFKYSSMMAQFSLYDENTWQVVSTCKIENEYGNKIECQCVARVTGTSDSPQVIYFEVR
ncbi:MAG: hypothetical protein Q4E67_08720, partial [Planctomycetia bacterium]|nr:hypothetical protein [Planctomycetia bacterium]